MPTSPAATGAAGVAFETKVAAACLTLLLTRGAPLCLGAGTLRTVHLQAGHLDLGWCTDDVLIEATNAADESMKAALQSKRTFTLSEKNAECVMTLHDALADFRNSGQFNRDRDVVALVTSSLSAKFARGIRNLLDCARASLSAPDMARRLAIPDYLGAPALDYYTTIGRIFKTAAGGPPSDDELWHFLRHFHVVDLDLHQDAGMIETLMRSLLAATIPDGDARGADDTWKELVALALSNAGRAASYTLEALPRNLVERHGKVSGFSTGVSRLLEDAAVVVDGIRTTINEKASIPRRELVGEICRLIEESQLVFVTGAAGSGKSALVKSAFSIATQGGLGFAFRAVSLAGSHINDVLHRFGLRVTELQAQTAMHVRKVLWVDSLERLLEKPAEQRAAFLDLLRTLKLDSTWRLVVTCRDYSAETVRSAFFAEVGMTPSDIEVHDLKDDELDEVATSVPSLARPLTSASLRRLLKNPFFLDIAAKMDWPESEPLPSTERAFREKVWRDVVRRIDEDMEAGLPNARGQVLVEVSLRRAKALEPFVAAQDLDSRALARLVRDSVLQSPSFGSNLYAPAHDVFEDWALMRWLDEEFKRHERQLDSLVGTLGTYPAIRRAYRRWLTESLDIDPQVSDSLVLALIQNQTVAAHWREDTLVAVLQSRDARSFLFRNIALLFADGAKMFRQVIHILRVACRAPLPLRLFGVDSPRELFMPKGSGWIGAGELLEFAIPSFTQTDLLLIVQFMEDWKLLLNLGLPYPRGATSIAKVAWYWLPRVPYRSPLRDGPERLFRILLSIPLSAEPTLSETVEKLFTDERHSRSDELVLNLIFNHFTSEAVFRDLPDLAFRVAEHSLGLDRSLEEVVADDCDHSLDAVQYAFGFGFRFSTDDFPSSTFHGPYLRMLWHHPVRGLDFIVRMINRACDAYANPNNEHEYIEQPDTITIRLNDEVCEQYANGRLWGAYRGMSVTPSCFQSALMALEFWLLEKAKRGDADVEVILLDLLRRSNNVAITAVIASVVTAHLSKYGEAAFVLLTNRFLLQVDLNRSGQESFNTAQMGVLGLPETSEENRLYTKERADSANLQHRRLSLEHVAVMLQTLDTFRERVWKLIDAYKAELPPEPEQDQGTKLWRLQLHRIDTRKFVETGRTEEGAVLIGSCTPEPDLQQLIEDQSPRYSAFESAVELLNWGRAAFEGRAKSDDWQAHLDRAEKQLAAGHDPDDNTALAAGGPAYVAAVCIRDHWIEMSPAQRDVSAGIVCDAVESDSDVTDRLSIDARNPMEGSRPAAFILSALFDKALSPTMRARLLPALSKAITHAVAETVNYAVAGVASFLWRSDRALALSCLQALVTDAVQDYDFHERQRRIRHFMERESYEAHQTELRSKMRDFVLNRGVGDEEQIAALDLSRFPGRSVARHLFTIGRQNPHDPLVRIYMERCVASMPTIWEVRQRRHRSALQNREREERFDPQIVHVFVDAISRYVLNLEPSEALQWFAPIFAVAATVPGEVAKLITMLIISQGDRAPAPTLWALWQRFADDFAAGPLVAHVDEEHSDEAAMLREIFLGINWNDARDWLPLHCHRSPKMHHRRSKLEGSKCTTFWG